MSAQPIYAYSIRITQSEQEQVEALRKHDKIKVIDIFRRGLTELNKEILNQPE